MARSTLRKSTHPALRTCYATLGDANAVPGTGEPQPTGSSGKSPLIGMCGKTACYLLFNGILGDKRTDGGGMHISAQWFKAM